LRFDLDSCERSSVGDKSQVGEVARCANGGGQPRIRLLYCIVTLLLIDVDTNRGDKLRNVEDRHKMQSAVLISLTELGRVVTIAEINRAIMK
jgi:hypothetical protein